MTLQVITIAKEDRSLLNDYLLAIGPTEEAISHLGETPCQVKKTNVVLSIECGKKGMQNLQNFLCRQKNLGSWDQYLASIQ